MKKTIEVDVEYGISIDCSLEDLLANDWIVQEEE